jgi:hypothetical protein
MPADDQAESPPRALTVVVTAKKSKCSGVHVLDPSTRPKALTTGLAQDVALAGRSAIDAAGLPVGSTWDLTNGVKITIGTGAKDLEGNPLAAPHQISFSRTLPGSPAP